MAVFDRLRYRRQDGAMFLFAFDLLEPNGQDLRRRSRPARRRSRACCARPGLASSSVTTWSTRMAASLMRTPARWVHRIVGPQPVGSGDCVRHLVQRSAVRVGQFPRRRIGGSPATAGSRARRSDGALWCPHANNKSAAVSSACRPKNPPGGHAARRAILWATRTVGRATSASQARVSLIVVPDVVP